MPLVAKNVTYRHSGATAPALRGLSLEIGAGHVVALCGAARTGRSTALALLAGLSAPEEGEVTVDGVRAAAPDARGRVGLLLQNADEALFGLTVRDDVMFAPLQLGLSSQKARDRAERALHAVELKPIVFGDRSPFSLSGGQRRRAAIAGLMAMEPAYLLLDEPFSGLDPQGRSETTSVIRSIATEGFGRHTGILVALSDLELALRLADHILILHGGHIVWQGSTAAYVTAPPEVDAWGLSQPELVSLSQDLRRRGWLVPVDKADPATLATAIAAHLRMARR